jgi:3-phosphoshikimate 1-carboxyvinyltransferase
LLKSFPEKGGCFLIEPDASSGSYFLGAGWLLRHSELTAVLKAAVMKAGTGTEVSASGLTNVSVRHWPVSGLQVDAEFLQLISDKRPPTEHQHGGRMLPSYGVFLTLPAQVSREQHLGDSIMTAAVLAPFVGQVIRLTDLGRLRVQESERVVGLRTELTKCGAKVLEEGDTLTRTLHGAEIETYNDHRMAMCFAILGLKVPGIKIINPSCVKKTFPDFFQKLAASAPHGLGATVLDAKTGNALSGNGLLPG